MQISQFRRHTSLGLILCLTACGGGNKNSTYSDISKTALSSQKLLEEQQILRVANGNRTLNVMHLANAIAIIDSPQMFRTAPIPYIINNTTLAATFYPTNEDATKWHRQLAVIADNIPTTDNFNAKNYLTAQLQQYLVGKHQNQNITILEEKPNGTKYLVLLGGDLQNANSRGKVIVGIFHRINNEAFRIQHVIKTRSFNIKTPETYPVTVAQLINLIQDLDNSAICNPAAPSANCKKLEAKFLAQAQQEQQLNYQPLFPHSK